MNMGTMRSHLRILLLVALFVSAGSLALGREVGSRFAAAAEHSTQHTTSGTQRASAPVALVYAQITGELGTPTPHHTSKPAQTSQPVPESGNQSTDSVLDVPVTDNGPQCDQRTLPADGSQGHSQDPASKPDGQDPASKPDGQDPVAKPGGQSPVNGPRDGPHDGGHESDKGRSPDCSVHGSQDASTTTTISAMVTATVTSVSGSTSRSVTVVSVTTQP